MTDHIAMVRELVGFVSPVVVGGADKLNDTSILRWVNDWYAKMVSAVYGMPVYLELVITGLGNTGIIAIGASNSTPPVLAADIVKTVEDFTFLSWPNIRSVGSVINRTADIADTDRAIMNRVSRSIPYLQNVFRGTDEYYTCFDYESGKGLVLLPTITKPNTVRINYKQNFIRCRADSGPGTVVFTGTGLNDMTASGLYTGSADATIRVEIQSNGTPDKFRWAKDYDPGAPVWNTSNVNITGLDQTEVAAEGISVKFAATTGHTIGTYWEFPVYKQDTPGAFFEEDDVMAPVNHAAYHCAVILGLTEPDRFLRDRDSLTADFIHRVKTQYTGPGAGFDNLLL